MIAIHADRSIRLSSVVRGATKLKEEEVSEEEIEGEITEPT